ncbi:MAG: penicillin-binding protein 2 [Hyphomicrobiales bacterium]|nr:penicillin-binding protein 2 [Hyphomicrobiales bacterium]
MTHRVESGPNASQARLAVACLCLAGAFATVSVRLALFGADAAPIPRLALAEAAERASARPDILDRNGAVLATDIRVYWLHADPSAVIHPDEAAEQLNAALPGLAVDEIRAKLRAGGRFVWLKRGLSPREAAAVHNLGVPGFVLTEQPQRVYPAGETFAHVLGHTDVDNRGLSGLERRLDAIAAEPGAPSLGVVRTTLDLRIQHAVRAELAAAMTRHRAKAAGAVLINVNDGGVLALASLPDFDPNRRDTALSPDRRNRVVADNYELGSVFKAFTAALALDERLVGRDEDIDIATPLVVNGFTIRDEHAKRRFASIDDVIVHSSNTGAARLGLLAGPQRQKAFLGKLGLLSPMTTAVGRTPPPGYGKEWRDINTATISYGHGLSTSPLHFAAAAASLVNGGYAVAPRFLTDAERAPPRQRVLKPETSLAMRRMLHAAVERGTGKRARAPGYGVGGKTGTALKPKPGGYSDEVVTSFFAAFPIQQPHYLLYVFLDEPQTEDGAPGNEAAYNAAAAAGEMLRRILPMLGIAPTGAALAEAPPPHAR